MTRSSSTSFPCSSTLTGFLAAGGGCSLLEEEEEEAAAAEGSALGTMAAVAVVAVDVSWCLDVAMLLWPSSALTVAEVVVAAKRPSSRGEVAEGAADRRISLPMEGMVMLESLAVLFVSFDLVLVVAAPPVDTPPAPEAVATPAETFLPVAALRVPGGGVRVLVVPLLAAPTVVIAVVATLPLDDGLPDALGMVFSAAEEGATAPPDLTGRGEGSMMAVE